MKRAVFSSLQNFVTVLQQNPSLMSVPSFTPLQGLLDKLKEDGKGCGCKKNAIYMQYKGLFEAALSGLSGSDREHIKSVLKVDKVCYYVKNNSNTLELICF